MPTVDKHKLDQYRKQVKILRKYMTGFDASAGYDLRRIGDWSAARKGAVTKAVEHIRHLTAKPHKIYRSRDKKRLRAVQKASQQTTYLKRMKVAVVPGIAPKVSITKKRGVVIRDMGLSRKTLDFADFDIDFIDLVTDTENAVRKITDYARADRYVIQAGEHDVFKSRALDSAGLGNAFDAESLPEAMQTLMNYYSSDKFDPDDYTSSYYENWLGGVIAYYFDRPLDFSKFQAAKERYKGKQKWRKERGFK